MAAAPNCWRQRWAEASMICRRLLLTGALAAPVVGAAALSWPRLADAAIGAIKTRLAAIPAGPALLASYVVAPDGSDFGKVNADAAYVYDNALAGLALLAAGEPGDAARIAEALLIAQGHDPNYTDGRLRNAYRAGAVALPVALPGWWDKRQDRWVQDPYQVGSEAGPMAWAMLLWTALAGKGVNAASYNQAARRAGNWINANLRAPQGFCGGFFGFPPHPRKLLWVSTEQNTDLAVAFTRLGMKAAAAHAAGLVRAMSDGHGLINAGLTPDGARNRMIAADANFWPLLARLMPGKTGIISALGWPRGRPQGIGFSEASQGIWLEGTGFAALWLRRNGDAPLAERFARTILGNFAPSGYVYATVPAMLRTGLTIGPDPDSPPFDYFRAPALAPTAWVALAAFSSNPLAFNETG
jgi:hypothetical protein